MNILRRVYKLLPGAREFKVTETQRVLLFKNGIFVELLNPGTYNRSAGFGNQFQTIEADVTNLEFVSDWNDILIKNYPNVVEKNFALADTNDRQVALVYRDGKVFTIVPPASRKLYWKALYKVTVEYVDMSENFEIAEDRAQVLSRAPNAYGNIMLQVVEQGFRGLLYIDGRLIKALNPGFYAFWSGANKVKVEVVDVRLNQMEVSGQEILTKDRVTIRVNLTGYYEVTDPMKAYTNIAKPEQYLYKELQFALRAAVANQTLDELLDGKNQLDSTILKQVQSGIESQGINVKSVGVKDIILPGEIREIMNRVVEAQKVAQANLINRREETAATRSLLNTARLMQDNPVLMKLKEMESLEKVVEKVNTLNVYGGLENVMSNLIPKGGS